MSNAVGLCKVSTEQQKQEGFSLEAQKDRIEAYCQDKNITLIRLFSFTESSTIGPRKQYHEMLNFIKLQNERPLKLIVDTVDRLNRSFNEFHELVPLIDENKIELHFIKESLVVNQDNYDSTSTNWELYTIGAHMYISALRYNVKRSNKRKIEKGEILRDSPIGYLNKRDDGNKSNVIIDLQTAPLVRKLFDKYATGYYTIKELTKYAKEIDLKSKRGKYIVHGQIARTLQNPFYIGYMNYKGQLVPHKYETFIPKELFERCQKLLKLNNKKIHITEHQEQFIFKGILTCKNCGCLITPYEKIKPSGLTYRYLRCSHYFGNCTQRNVSEKIVLEQIIDLLEQLKIPSEILYQISNQMEELVHQETLAIQEKTSSLKTEILKKEDKKSKVLSDYIDGTIDGSEYKIIKSTLENQISALNKELAIYSTPNSNISQLIGNIMYFTNNLKNLFMSSQVIQKRAILKMILANSYLDDNKLLFSLRKPFNLFTEIGENLKWRSQ